MNFVEFLDAHDIDYVTEGDHHCRPNWIQMKCPVCNDGSESNHLGYSLHGNYANCWKCGPKPLPQLAALLTGLPYNRIRALLTSRTHGSGASLKPRGKLVMPSAVQPMLPAHRRYLRERGYDPEQLERLWNVQGIGPASKLAWRLFVPVYLANTVVSWTTRSISKESSALRWVSAKPEHEAISIKHLLYGWDYVRTSAIVHEGPSDVWATGPGSVGVMGIGFSTKQILLLSRLSRVAVCFDAEPQAQKRASALCEVLMSYKIDVTQVTLESGKDSATASRKEMNQLRRLFLK